MSKKAKIAMILASTINGEIGYKNTIPWKLSGDLARFKQQTMDNVVIVGRSTYESLPGPLVGRIVIVLTRDPAYASDVHDPVANVYSASSLPEAIEKGREFKTQKIFLAGGASIYEEGMEFADIVYLTIAHKAPMVPKYDTKIKNFGFPKETWGQFEQRHVFEEIPGQNEFTRLSHSFYIFERLEK